MPCVGRARIVGQMAAVGPHALASLHRCQGWHIAIAAAGLRDRAARMETAAVDARPPAVKRPLILASGRAHRENVPMRSVLASTCALSAASSSARVAPGANERTVSSAYNRKKYRCFPCPGGGHGPP